MVRGLNVGDLSEQICCYLYKHMPVPFVPVFPGQDAYQGTLLHSSAFQNGRPFQNQKVLVIGSGNSASDIALDL